MKDNTKEPVIQLANGDVLNPFRFSAEKHFDPETFAHSMAHICRYTGHSKVFYSVAQHTLLVSKIAGLLYLDLRFADGKARKDFFEVSMMGLLHDAIEPLINDISAPIKRSESLRGLVSFEDAALTDLYEFHGLKSTRENLEIIKEADNYALSMEVITLMRYEHPVWNDHLNKFSPSRFANKLWVTEDSANFAKWKNLWLKRYQDLILKLRRVSDG